MATALKPGDRIGLTLANSAVGQYMIALAKRTGIKPSRWSAGKQRLSRYGSGEPTSWSSTATASAIGWPRPSTAPGCTCWKAPVTRLCGTQVRRRL